MASFVDSTPNGKLFLLNICLLLLYRPDSLRLVPKGQPTHTLPASHCSLIIFVLYSNLLPRLLSLHLISSRGGR